MTNEEAIKSALDKVKKQKENFGFMDRFNVDENWEVMQALEKQIPKKPHVISNRGKIYRNCPTCTSNVEDPVIGKRYLHNCGVCGQRIDWGEGASE